MNMYKKRILRHPYAGKLLRNMEAIYKEKFIFKKSDENFSYYQDGVINISKKNRWATTWTNRLLFHEFGHAFWEMYKKHFDRAAYRRLFNGKYSAPYTKYSAITFVLNINVGRRSVTTYGKTHPEEAFAEAFSFVLANVDDSEEGPKVIEQLAYIEWAIENALKKKKKWGKFKQYTTLVECEECEETFDLDCRKEEEIEGWTFACPHCKSLLTY